MTPWLHIVGIGADGWSGLGQASRRAISEAALILGAERQLALLPDGTAGETWRDLPALLDRLRQARQTRLPTCLLASGDPMWHGIGASLCQHLQHGEYIVLPAVSCRSLAAARLGWPLQETLCLSLHNRPPSALLPHLAPRTRLLLLSRDGTTPEAVARLLCESGYGESQMFMLEHLGAAQERIRTARADAFGLDDIAGLNMLAVETPPHGPAGNGPAGNGPAGNGLFGIPDDAFQHDGNITCRELRAVALARLAPFAGARLWDIGAGSGSLGVEWMRLHPANRAIAIEARAERCRLIEANRAAFGVPGLDIRNAAAPAALAGLPPPDAVFIGGGVATPGVLEAAWQALPANGRLVAHAVSVQGEAALLRFRQQSGGELLRMGRERLEALGGMEGWRPERPVVMLEARR